MGTVDYRGAVILLCLAVRGERGGDHAGNEVNTGAAFGALGGAEAQRGERVEREDVTGDARRGGDHDVDVALDCCCAVHTNNERAPASSLKSF
jgi:hypothetical protein